MRVIKPPKKTQLPTGQYTWEFSCDDGKTYLSADLARLIGLASQRVLMQRVARVGWDSEFLLVPPAKRGLCLSGESPRTRGNAEFMALSCKSRAYKIKEIQPWGAWEKCQASNI